MVGERPILAVKPPTAVDAQGTPIEVFSSVSDGAFTVRLGPVGDVSWAKGSSIACTSVVSALGWSRMAEAR